MLHTDEILKVIESIKCYFQAVLQSFNITIIFFSIYMFMKNIHLIFIIINHLCLVYAARAG